MRYKLGAPLIFHRLLRQFMRYKIQVSVISFYAGFILTACGSSEPKITPQATVLGDMSTLIATNEITSVQTQIDVIKIVFLGDSLTAGFGLPQEQAWPEQVQKRLKAAGYKTAIINAGVSGDTTANGLARYDWSVGSAEADILVLALGANDFLQGVSPATTRQNLKMIIERAQNDGMEIILAGVATPQLDQLGPAGRAYASIYPELAAEYKLSFFASMLEGVSGRADLLQSDGLHPTQAGVEIMADRFTQHLRSELDN